MGISKTELARQLGHPASRISEWSARGMPSGDPEAARAWIAAHIKPRAKRGPKKSAPVTPLQAEAGAATVAPVATSDQAPSETDTSWPAKIARAHRVELMLYDAINRALREKQIVQLQSLLASYTRGFASIAEAEEVGLNIQIKRRELVTIEDAQSVLATILTPIRQALEALPVVERARCNPTDPHVAGEALDAWVKALLVRISGLEASLGAHGSAS